MTTYTYTGLDYTEYHADYLTPESFFTLADLLAQAHSLGPNLNMTFTVPDGVTDGSFALSPLQSNGPTVDMIITSGSYTLDTYHCIGSNCLGTITLSNGAVSDWVILTQVGGPCGTGALTTVPSCNINSHPGFDSIGTSTGFSGDAFGASVHGFGTWSPVPAPIVGTGLPVVIAAVLLLARLAGALKQSAR